MEDYERNILNELIQGKRCLGLLTPKIEIIDFVIKNNLDYNNFTFSKNNSIENIAVAPRKMVREVVTKEKIKEINLPKYEEKVIEIITSLDNTNIAKAVIKIQNYFIDNKYKSPEVDIIYGILFDYKPCDIKYYVQTRDDGLPKHKYEDILEQKIGNRERTLEEQHVICEECALEYLGKI